MKTEYNTLNYNIVNIVNGVAQDYIPCPLLLILYVNDLYKALIKSYSIVFADDIDICSSEKKISSLNIGMFKVLDWFDGRDYR